MRLLFLGKFTVIPPRVTLNRRFDESGEQRMRLQGFAFEFGMKLDRDKPGVFRHFNDFDQAAVWAGSGKLHPVGFELLTIEIVELVPVTMAFEVELA